MKQTKNLKKCSYRHLNNGIFQQILDTPQDRQILCILRGKDCFEKIGQIHFDR